MTSPTTGLQIPLVTPFDAAGRVDLQALEALAHHLLDAGADGLVALGTTAEAPTLSAAEQDAVVDCCIAVCTARGAALTVGAGGNDTAAVAREAARRGEQEGIAALLSVVPPYSRPSRAGVLAHFEQVAAAGPLPLLVYEIPQRTGIRLGAEGLLSLHAAAPSVVGVKLSLPALDDDALELLALAPPSFAVMTGEDQLIFSAGAAGARGAITAAAHCATARFAALLAALERGELVAARDGARELRPLVRALYAEPNPAVIKAVLHARGLIATADVRLPLVRASAGAVAAAVAALDALGGS